jgi:cytochrome c oxidase assembly protein subunit 15
VDDDRIRRLATTTTIIIYLQILVGAVMRHTDAGLAIPDFPWMFGHLVPDHWDARIAVHFLHRVGALVATAFILATAVQIWLRRRLNSTCASLTRPTLLIVGLVLLQITLGALTVLSKREVWINSLHLVCGALVLATSIVITLKSWRARLIDATEGASSTLGSARAPDRGAVLAARADRTAPSRSHA